ncbi:hypothetical protein P3X46_022301 [Hevea brasiliensis]|uniref:Pentacotripeptide-repeat region of PRORP domain-containing protein n=1 Tax=Hevea brasiliensis TaxID=3981 RepID=A0ABQ9L7G0_HEVBR|nr:hypothetical protein P3X46_022301 [Hevea brasiliensis]
MEKSRLKVNCVSYNILINGMCRAGRLTDAKELFPRLFEKALKPHVYTYRFLRHKDIPEATLLIDEMVDKGFSADAATFELINRCLKSGTFVYKFFLNFVEIYNFLILLLKYHFLFQQVSHFTSPQYLTRNEMLSVLQILFSLEEQLSWQMKMLVVTLINYAIAMAIEHELQTHSNSNYKICARNICLLLVCDCLDLM